MNTLSKKQQMDIVIRFWHKGKSRVLSCYLTSAFLGKTRASDLLQAFKNCIPNKIIKKTIQVSMDGPNVNLNFLRELQDAIKNTNDATHELINIGTCGLHVMHNAFKAGIKIVKWEIVEFLKALFNLLIIINYNYNY